MSWSGLSGAMNKRDETDKTNQIDQTDHPTEQRLVDCYYAASDVSSVGFFW